MTRHRIIPRAEWGAVHPNGCATAPLPATEVWLHHSVTIAPDLVPPWDDDDAAIRTLERIGQQRFGCGISYTWCITPSGRIYEGHSPNRQGTHTSGRNDRARAVCLVGDYNTTRPTAAQLDAIDWLLRHAHTVGWIAAARLDGGHRDLKATGCPGDRAYALIPTINAYAALLPPITGGTDDMTPEQAEQLTGIQYALGTAETATVDAQHPAGVHIGTQVSETRAGVRELLARPAPAEIDYDQLAAALWRQILAAAGHSR